MSRRSEAAAAGDFYETPEWATKAIISELLKTGLIIPVLDPCAGTGAILRVLRRYYPPALVGGLELNVELAKDDPWIVVANALAVHWPGYQTVIMNPPYSMALAFVNYALAELRPRNGTVAALLRLGMLSSQRRADFWRRNPADVYVLPRRPSFTADGRTDASDYAWFVWGPSRGGRWQILDVPSIADVEPDPSYPTHSRDDDAL